MANLGPVDQWIAGAIGVTLGATIALVRSPQLAESTCDDGGVLPTTHPTPREPNLAALDALAAQTRHDPRLEASNLEVLLWDDPPLGGDLVALDCTNYPCVASVLVEDHASQDLGFVFVVREELSASSLSGLEPIAISAIHLNDGRALVTMSLGTGKETVEVVERSNARVKAISSELTTLYAGERSP